MLPIKSNKGICACNISQPGSQALNLNSELLLQSYAILFITRQVLPGLVQGNKGVLDPGREPCLIWNLPRLEAFEVLKEQLRKSFGLLAVHVHQNDCGSILLYRTAETFKRFEQRKCSLVEGRFKLAHAFKDFVWAEGDHVRRKKDTNINHGRIVGTPGNLVQQSTQPVDALEAGLGCRNGLLFTEKYDQPLKAAVSCVVIQKRVVALSYSKEFVIQACCCMGVIQKSINK